MDIVIGSIFTQERARDKDALISDLQSELRRTQAKLTEESRKRAEAEANVRRLKRAEYERTCPQPPSGDRDKGYRCTFCSTPIEWPFEQNYCSYCGKGIDWRTRNDQMYDSARDRAVDENLAYDLAGDR